MKRAKPTDERRIAIGRSDSTATSQTLYFDAVGPDDIELDEDTVDGILQDQLAHIDSDGAVSSAFLYGVKPLWGWDYVLSFKIPEQLISRGSKRPIKEPTVVIRRRNGSHKSFCSSQNVPGDSDLELDDREADSKQEQSNEKAFEELTRARVEILARLKSAGFVFSQLFVPSEGVILVRISLPERCMKAKAMKLGMELRLKEEYGGGYLSFSSERQEAFLNHDEQRHRNSYFCPADRAMIIVNVLQSKEDWGCGLNIELLLYEKTLLQAFAIHSELERKTLIAETVWKRIWDPTYLPPFNALKDYLGGELLSKFDSVQYSYVISSVFDCGVLTNPYVIFSTTHSPGYFLFRFCEFLR